MKSDAEMQDARDSELAASRRFLEEHGYAAQAALGGVALHALDVANRYALYHLTLLPALSYMSPAVP